MALEFEFVTGSDATLDKDNLTIVRKMRARDKLPVAVGSDYFDTVSSAAMAWIIANAPTYGTPWGTLFWNSVQIHENYYALDYSFSVTYGKNDKAAGAYQITVDQSGGTVHVTAGTRIGVYGPAADRKDNFGLIGADGDKVTGVDIPVEETKLTVMFRHPERVLNAAYIKNIGRLVGYPNNATFLTYAAGEVLYLGGNFTETDTEASASYSFAISYNRTNFDVGGITVGEKKGWDVLSPTYKEAVVGGHGVRKVQCIEIIRPAGRAWADYAAFGWGS